jgi:hypothetical protein
MRTILVAALMLCSQIIFQDGNGINVVLVPTWFFAMFLDWIDADRGGGNDDR